MNARYGVGLFNIIAVLISWKLNASVLWAIIHGLLGIFYVLYWAIFLGAHL